MPPQACQGLRGESGPLPLLVVSLPNKDPDAPPNRYIIKRPVARPSIPVGRSTRTSVTYDLQMKKCVFMKDSWRVVAGNAPIEGRFIRVVHSIRAKSRTFRFAWTSATWMTTPVTIKFELAPILELMLLGYLRGSSYRSQCFDVTG